MCGRFAASASADDYVEMFGVHEVVDRPVPSYNVAPTDPVAAIVERTDKESGDVVRKLVTPRWGLVPSWSKDDRGGARMINARWETVDTKPAFRKAFAARRCLIPADGYYEWYETAQRGPGGRPLKQPYFLHVDGGLPFVMAGIYEFWRRPDATGAGEWLTTCSIITTAAADAAGHLHDRMPMSVPEGCWGNWLSPAVTDAREAKALLSVVEPAALRAYPVSTLVNQVANDGPELLIPVR